MRCGAIHRDTPSDVLRLSRYLSRDSRPSNVDWTRGLTLGDPLGNDVFGDCVEAATLRLIQLWRTLAMGDNWRPTEADALALYKRFNTTFDPTDPSTDTGTDCVSAMQSWASQGIKLGAQLEDVPKWVSITPSNLSEISNAVRWFGGVLLTYELPSTVDGNQSIWDVAPDGTPFLGMHRVLCAKCDPSGSIYVESWGQRFQVTPSFHAAYCRAADAMVSRLWLNTWGMSPSGLDITTLLSDAATLSHQPS